MQVAVRPHANPAAIAACRTELLPTRASLRPTIFIPPKPSALQRDNAWHYRESLLHGPDCVESAFDTTKFQRLSVWSQMNADVSLCAPRIRELERPAHVALRFA